MVAFLLEQRGLKPGALWRVLGLKGRVSEILSGKRAISKDQAKKLATFFHVGSLHADGTEQLDAGAVNVVGVQQW